MYHKHDTLYIVYHKHDTLYIVYHKHDTLYIMYHKHDTLYIMYHKHDTLYIVYHKHDTIYNTETFLEVHLQLVKLILYLISKPFSIFFGRPKTHLYIIY